MTTPTMALIHPPTDWADIRSVFEGKTNGNLLWIVGKLLLIMADDFPSAHVRLPFDDYQITITIEPTCGKES